jgi:hypothetical protein
MRALTHLVLLAAAVLCLVSVAGAQITVIREKNGKEFGCSMSGLVTTENDCDGHWYKYVFVGVITDAKDAPNAYGPEYGREKRLQIRPEEVFRGNPPAVLTVTTNQTQCGADQNIGDRWLFYVQQEKDGEPLVVDVYAGGSAPVEEANAKLETLRRLKAMSDRGILRGEMLRQFTDEDAVERNEPIANQRVVAERESDHQQFFATSDTDGRFEFEPLLPAKYRILPDAIYQWRTDAEEHQLAARECTDFVFTFRPDGRLLGRVTDAQGKPLAGVDVVAQTVMASGERYYSGVSGSDGRFIIKDVPPGRYLLGLNLNVVGNDERQAVFYPGVRSRAKATVFTVGMAEKREHLDFAIPSDK